MSSVILDEPRKALELNLQSVKYRSCMPDIGLGLRRAYLIRSVSEFQDCTTRDTMWRRPLSCHCARDAYIPRSCHCCYRGAALLVPRSYNTRVTLLCLEVVRNSALTILLSFPYQTSVESDCPLSDLSVTPIMISFITRKRGMRKGARCAVKIAGTNPDLTTTKHEADQVWTRDLALHPQSSQAQQNRDIKKVEKLEAAVGEKLGYR